MKSIWVTLLILGVLLVLVNVPVYIIGKKNPEIPNAINRVAYYVGKNLAFILGALCLFISYRVNKKWKLRKQKGENENLIESIGSKK